ncbi:PREDICTED: MHC class II regulatory factor RFX1-like, partial [Corvus brachyrhynchos]|uniref:MHC class II regulatory factor RFX1-like n=1 Tax=Corvus brachyrhynchos TaxID=85066 RepID=UPI0008167209
PPPPAISGNPPDPRIPSDASRTLPEFPEIDVQGKGLPEGAGAEDLRVFQQLYREHCEAIVDVMINLQFSLVETLWKSFWRCSGETEAENLHPQTSTQTPRSALTQAIRNFAKSLESWLGNAMVSMPEEMVRVKVGFGGSLGALGGVLEGLRGGPWGAQWAVLQNTAQISQMLSDLNRVDFANVQEQAAWVCRCEARVVQRLEQDFKATLGQQHSLEQWAAWLDAVVGRVLRPHLGTPGPPRGGHGGLRAGLRPHLDHLGEQISASSVSWAQGSF